jgi:hypothetical protein
MGLGGLVLRPSKRFQITEQAYLVDAYRRKLHSHHQHTAETKDNRPPQGLYKLFIPIAARSSLRSVVSVTKVNDDNNTKHVRVNPMSNDNSLASSPFVNPTTSI